MIRVRPIYVFFLAIFSIALISLSESVYAEPDSTWQRLWPKTDFTKITVPLAEIQSGGPGKDGIPAIDHPQFASVREVGELPDDEPVIGVTIGNDAKAYPLRILIWHEIVNDQMGDMPVAVTYCPLCNTSIVFDRRIDNRVLDFGTTGNLRHSDLIMYDRQTESWWQQYSGESIVGQLSGTRLKVIPSRLESYKKFRDRFPDGKVLIPNDPSARDYGANPYAGYDRSPLPFLFKGLTPKGVSPMMRVVAINDVAFTLPLIQSQGTVQHAQLKISWESGQRSALDDSRINKGADVGNILVTKNGQDVPYVVTFAFAFFAFNPEGELHGSEGIIRQANSAK